jgi:hypothetical protein
MEPVGELLAVVSWVLMAAAQPVGGLLSSRAGR